MTELPPDMPASWLAQLREVLRENTKKAVWFAILGSSVAAAFVTVFGNLGLEWYKARKAAEIERYKTGKAAEIELYKTCLDSHREDLRVKRAEYSTLSENYRLLSKDFDDCVATCETALKHRNAPQMMRFAYDSLDGMARRLITIQTSERNANLDQGIRTTLADIREALGPALVDVSNDQTKQPNLSKLPEFVQTCNAVIRPKIDGLEDRIRTTMKNLQAEPCPQ